MTGLEIATPLLRGAHLAAMLSAFGGLIFRDIVLPRQQVAADRDSHFAAVTRVVRISAWLAFVLGGVWFAAVAGTMARATSIFALPTTLPLVAMKTAFGGWMCLRLALLAGLLVLCRRLRPLARILSLLAAGIGIAVQPRLGHAGAMEGAQGLIFTLIEAAHLQAAGAWLGGLLPLVLAVSRSRAADAAELCERFTPVGLVAVGIIAITAMPQAAELIGGIGGLFGTRYGQMALAKLGLFLVALLLACLNRFVLTPRLRQGLSRRSLTLSIGIELVAGILILIAAAAMASLPPGVHTQPDWPFAWRPSTVAWEEPELRWELIQPLIAIGTAGVLIAVSLMGRSWPRRRRALAIILAVAGAVPFTPALSLFLVEAFPTSYAVSPTGFSVETIVRGRDLFARDCAACHDPNNGTNRAADLLAPHLWDHGDGELFWRLTAGFTDPRGEVRMPPFETVLSADDRWSLIDFIRARNAGWHVRTSGQWTPLIAAPEMPIRCEAIGAATLSDLRGRVVLVEAGDMPSDRSVYTHEADVVTIRLSRGAVTSRPVGACVSISDEAWDALAIFAGVESQALAGSIALVDEDGWLRAMLPSEISPELMRFAIRKVRRERISAQYGTSSLHRH